MIEVLLGSKNAERVLIYIFAREEGYAREIATFYESDLKSIQMQLDKFEKSGVLASRSDFSAGLIVLSLDGALVPAHNASYNRHTDQPHAAQQG